MQAAEDLQHLLRDREAELADMQQQLRPEEAANNAAAHTHPTTPAHARHLHCVSATTVAQSGDRGGGGGGAVHALAAENARLQADLDRMFLQLAVRS